MRRIDRRLVLLSFVLVCDVVSVFGRPQEHSTAGSQLKADSDGRVDNRKEDAQATPIFVFAQTTGGHDAGDARSHTTKSPPPPSPMMGDSVRTVSDQLLQSSTSTSNMIVSSELRTVPTKNESPLSVPLQGEAVPVLTDEDVHAVGPYSYKISSDGSTRPTGGDLSTWILLGGGGGGESSPAPLNMATIKKVPKPADATPSSFIVQQQYEMTTSSSSGSSSSSSTAVVTRKRKPSTTTTTTTTTTTEKTTVHLHRSPAAVTESPIKLQDSKFKNKTPVIVGKIPSNITATAAAVRVDEPATSPLPELSPVDGNTRFGTPVVTFPHVPPRQRPSANNTKKAEKPEKPLTTKITSTAVVISKPATLNHTSSTAAASATTVAPAAVPAAAAAQSNAVAVNNATEVAPTGVTDSSVVNSSTVKNNTSLKKKKKKNKNKNKRRPVQKTSADENAQSKIDEQNAKLPSGRPLSTRIYNYLAREVMPNVGVGLVGLMLTAGLAGLLLYSPLGGAAIPLVPLRRNDPHVGHGHGHGSSGGYAPPPEADNSQPEEQVFGQVLSGMSYGHNPYGRERPADPAVPKFKPSYQTAEYPAVHDVPKYTGGGHDTSAKYAAHDATKYPAADTTKYSTTHDGTKYAVVESTKYSAPDTNGKYSAQDSVSKYSTIDESVATAGQDSASSSYPSLQQQQQQQQDASQGVAAYDQQTALQQDVDDDQTYQNHHYDQIKFDSSNAYDQPKYTPSAGSAYRDDQSSFDAPKYPGYVQDVPKEDAVIYNFDNHRTTDDKDGSTASPSSDPSFSALQGVPKFYDPSADPEQISVNVHQTMKMEHGPRSLRIRRQVDEHNEIDAQLPAEETTARQGSEETTSDKATESQTDGESAYSTTSATTTTTTMPMPTTTTTTASTTTTSSEKPTSAPSNQFSLVDLFRRVAEVKLKMGIEILRSTAASFTQYVNAIQRRMTHMVRSLQKSNDRQQSDAKQEQNAKSTESTVTEEKRQRRSTRHRMYSN